jgi:soluble lytic murein transglycosylase-like protein
MSVTQEQRTQPPRPRRKGPPRWVRDGALVVTLVAAIAYAATIVKPIYAGRAPVIGEVIRGVSNQPQQPQAPVSPVLSGPLADSVRQIEASPEFQEQRRRFSADLVATGRMSQARADSIAHFAVREAFLRGVPPAVIFGVMLTENAQFISHAKSNVGAVGLMQVYPKYWFKSLSKQFNDPNIEADSTNLRYGVFILEHYLKPRGKKSTGEHVIATAPGSLMKGLLRYNGCVRGTNTPRCHTYPNKVQKFVERDAQALCGDQTFYQCIAQPFMAGLLGQRAGD